MKHTKIAMINIYKTYEYDWMNFLINNDLTYHHIKKEEDGGLYTIENGALLTDRAHAYLHRIERVDYEIYKEINKVFKQINIQRDEPNDSQKLKIQLLLLKYELKNADKLIKRKEKLGKNRRYVATLRRRNSQEMR